MANTKLSKTKIKTLFYSLLFLSIIIVFVSYYYISKSEAINNSPVNEVKKDNKQASFQMLTNVQNDVEFQVAPLSTSEFKVEVNTHSVDLNFDLTKISNLYDDTGNYYKPIKWEGSAPGGHHRSGILKFSSLNSNAKSIKLIINDGITREFKWDLK